MSSLPIAVASLLWHWNRGRVVVHEQHEAGIEAFAGAMEKMFTGGHVGRLLVDVATADGAAAVATAPQRVYGDATSTSSASACTSSS